MAMHPLESSVHQALFDALRSQVETHLNDRILDYADGLANRDDFTKALDAVADKAYQQLEEELFGAPPPTPQFFDGRINGITMSRCYCVFMSYGSAMSYCGAQSLVHM